jgi:hypothetical protein
VLTQQFLTGGTRLLGSEIDPWLAKKDVETMPVMTCGSKYVNSFLNGDGLDVR